MKVSTAQPFQIIYSLFQHEYLGYLLESFVVQLDEKNRLTFQHQNISSRNAEEFSSGLNETDYKLIALIDEIQQEAIVKQFYNKKIKPIDFFLKIFNKEKGNKALQDEICDFVEKKRSEIFSLIEGKMLFEMGNDGEPTWRQIEILEEKATILFHFRRNEDNTHYFPTIKYQGEKVHFQYQGAYIVCREPAYLVLNSKLYGFQQNIDANKLNPFLNKKFIVIPQKVEETYFKKFVAPLVASFDVYAKGFEINSSRPEPVPTLTFSQLVSAQQATLFENGNGGNEHEDFQDEKILFDLSFQYGDFQFSPEQKVPTSVSVEKKGDSYVFHRIKRALEQEKSFLEIIRAKGLDLKPAKATFTKPDAFSWLSKHKVYLEEQGIKVLQQFPDKKYFLGEASIKVEINENIDWFDVNAIITFGPYEIPFQKLRRMFNKKQREITLPNGEVAVIPEVWFNEYAALFAFSEESTSINKLKLKKHHLSLVQDLEKGALAEVHINRKLEKLRNFESIAEYDIPTGFAGLLRPYQKAGYNWMRFLAQYRLGGCLADDMGLGKTVQTLALLQSQKVQDIAGASLLIMPTSLIYNWEMEAKKFTPELKVLIYTGTNRDKNIERFQDYDLVLTSYGITRLDIELLQSYYFNYIILDESQAIKNPRANIAKAVRKLKSQQKLILSGTPIENSTMDLWSQMNFINPGLLGNQTFFRDEFLNPIEKKQDADKIRKLYAIIKPFVLRRHKSQVATELPPKIEQVKYCSMSDEQEQRYEEAKSYYRNKILESIDSKGVSQSQFLLLQGLNQLRQIANHPKMIDQDYEGDSGKMEDITYMLDNAIRKGHKILIFSQFVKHLSLLKTYLDTNKIDYAYLDGATKNRQEQVNLFQDNEALQVFLISLKAGGLGLNLTKADYVFLLDPWWNPAAEAQAVDRAHRIGQENKVFTYKFITKNTVEEKILALQKNKLKLASELISTEEKFVKNLSKEDIHALLD